MAFSLEKALKARVVMLSGEESALRNRALVEIVNTVTTDDDFDIEHFMTSESEPQSWSASAGTAPFLSERRTVIVRHLLREEEMDLKGWGELPQSALLVLVADDEPGDENKLRRLANLRGQWEKAIEGVGGYVEKFRIDPKQVVESIRQEAAARGKKLSPSAASLMAEMNGSSLSRSLEELEKVLLFIGNREQITEPDIRAVVLPSREYNVFRMTDSALMGDVAEALRQLRILTGSSIKADEAAHSRILPTMLRQLRLIWQAKVVLEARVPVDNPPESVTQMFPESVSLAKQQPFVRTKAIQVARSVSFNTLSECFRILSDTDARLKGMLPSLNGMESLEQMVLQMARTVKGAV